MPKNPVVAMDIPSSGFGGGGGPFTSATRTMESGLKEKYDFKPILYKKEMGSGISIKRIKDLKAQIKEINPDIVHYTGLQLSGFHMAVACKLAGVKHTVVTVRGFSGDVIFFSKVKKMILTYFLEPITLLLSKRVIGVSNYVVGRKMIRLFAKRKRQAIYNFPPPEITPTDPSNSLRKELNIKDTDLIIVSVARITRDKGYQVLEKAMQDFPDMSDVKFVIVGDGDYLETMKEGLKKKVEEKKVFFLGFRRDVMNILNASDVFVLPTLHETLSVALLEASRSSLALIASRTGGVPEIVEDGHNGILVPVGNSKKLTDAMVQVAQNRELIKTYGQNAKQRLQIKFSAKSIEDKIDKVYSSLLSK